MSARSERLRARSERLVAVGRVGRPHGRDGAFWVEGALVPTSGEGAVASGSGGGSTAAASGARVPDAAAASSGSCDWIASGGASAADPGLPTRTPLEPGAEVTVGGMRARVEHVSGSLERPLVRLSGVPDRSAAAALRGESLLVPEEHAPLGPDDWLVDDLVGACVEGMGEVRRVLAGPSCDLLEVGEEATLVPLVHDAIVRIDAEAGLIEVDRRFLALEEGERGGVEEHRMGAARRGPQGRARGRPPSAGGAPPDGDRPGLSRSESAPTQP